MLSIHFSSVFRDYDYQKNVLVPLSLMVLVKVKS